VRSVNGDFAVDLSNNLELMPLGDGDAVLAHPDAINIPAHQFRVLCQFTTVGAQ
jgi:hypothetical protein